MSHDLVALMEASSLLDTAELVKLVEAGADVNQADSAGHSPLHIASASGNDVAVRFLLQNGANIHATSKSGWTPLHRAAAAGKLSTVKILVTEGANPNAKTRKLELAADLARKSSHTAVVTYLTNYAKVFAAKQQSEAVSPRTPRRTQTSQPKTRPQSASTTDTTDDTVVRQAPSGPLHAQTSTRSAVAAATRPGTAPAVRPIAASSTATAQLAAADDLSSARGTGTRRPAAATRSMIAAASSSAVASAQAEVAALRRELSSTKTALENERRVNAMLTQQVRFLSRALAQLDATADEIVALSGTAAKPSISASVPDVVAAAASALAEPKASTVRQPMSHRGPASQPSGASMRPPASARSTAQLTTFAASAQQKHTVPTKPASSIVVAAAAPRAPGATAMGTVKPLAAAGDGSASSKPARKPISPRALRRPTTAPKPATAAVTTTAGAAGSIVTTTSVSSKAATAAAAPALPGPLKPKVPLLPLPSVFSADPPVSPRQPSTRSVTAGSAATGHSLSAASGDAMLVSPRAHKPLPAEGITVIPPTGAAGAAVSVSAGGGAFLSPRLAPAGSGTQSSQSLSPMSALHSPRKLDAPLVPRLMQKAAEMS